MLNFEIVEKDQGTMKADLEISGGHLYLRINNVPVLYLHGETGRLGRVHCGNLPLGLPKDPHNSDRIAVESTF